MLRIEQGIALMLTDIVLPGGLNGRELADAALATYPGLKALFMSGYTGAASRHFSNLPPGTDLLQKPFSIQLLAETIRKTFDRAAEANGKL
jgi:DNA-binding NtrC family response regulator